VTFLTPLAALAALAAALPLGVAAGRARRAATVRERLGLPPPPRRGAVAFVAALGAVPLLVGLAASQPVLEFAEERRERTDVEAFVVVDISRSMLAATGPEGETRFDRAREIAAEIRAALPEVPLGIVSLTDRALPQLFPTTDAAVFASALERSIGVERPPPRLFFAERATDLDAAAAVLQRGYFDPDARTRLLVLVSDGETRERPARFAAAVREDERTHLVVVPVWAAGERVHTGGVPEPAYEADPAGPATLAQLAADADGRLVPEAPERVAAAAREIVGDGPTRVAARDGRELALMPWITALALLPLGLVLWRRNL